MGGFLPLVFMLNTKLSNTTKLFEEHEAPPIANVLLAAAILLGDLVRINVIISTLAVLRFPHNFRN